MTAQVKVCGNNQGVRPSKEILNDRNIVVAKTFKHRTLEERAAGFEGQLGPYEEFAWGSPAGRERW